MAQRVAVAAARAGCAPLLLADEPTKGLDADLRAAVVALLRDALQAGGSLLCITHDVAVARALGGEVMVMLEGEVVERGAAEQVLGAPSHAYTRRLLAAEPEAWPDGDVPVPGAEILSAHDLAAERGGRRLFEGLSLAVGAGEWVAVTGPSGCGKTTLGNALLGLLRPAAGEVRRRGGLKRTRYQKLYQDPVATFAPRLALRTALAEAAALHRVPWTEVAATLDRLRVLDALLDRRPDQVSGGELQRIAIARALLPDPVFLFADEPTSRLDPITQQETMAALRDVSRERGLAVLLVTHDHAMARKMAARQVELCRTA
jgi:peptide/nickel transport system ATP-binding protein